MSLAPWHVLAVWSYLFLLKKQKKMALKMEKFYFEEHQWLHECTYKQHLMWNLLVALREQTSSSPRWKFPHCSVWQWGIARLKWSDPADSMCLFSSSHFTSRLFKPPCASLSLSLSFRALLLLLLSPFPLLSLSHLTSKFADSARG